MEGLQRVRALVVISALGVVTLNSGEWLQQIPGATSGASVQRNTVLGIAKILSQH